MNTVQLDLDAMKEVVTEYYPDFFTRQSKWSKWTLENIFNIITYAGNDEHLESFLTDVVSYMGEAIASELRSAHEDYVEYERVCSDNRLAAEEAGLFYEKYIAPLVPLIINKPDFGVYPRRQRFSIMNFIKGSKDAPLTEWEHAPKDMCQLIRRAREIYYDVIRHDVNELIDIMPDWINADCLRLHCADRNVEDIKLYIQCDAPDFDAVEPSVDAAIKAARMHTGAMYQTDPHDLMGKIIVPFAVAKHKLSKANMDILHDRLGQFISAIMRMDSNIVTVFADCEPVMRDMAVNVVNAYREHQYTAKLELERYALLAINDKFGKEVMQYYIPAIVDYVLSRTEECDVPPGDLRDLLDKSRKEYTVVEQRKSISKDVLLDWSSTLTARQHELVDLMVFADNRERDLVIKALLGYNVEELLGYVRGDVKLYADGLNETLALALKRTRLNYLSNIRQDITKGAKNMAMTINYHGRLEVADNALKGTLTLSIDGELAIVDVDANYGESQVRYNWETIPKVGYDTTLHSQVIWLGHDAAVNIIVVVYKDGGIASTVTFTKDLSGVVL